MLPPSEDIKDILEDNSIGTFAGTSGWGIFISEMPPSPDTCILINESPAHGNRNPNYSYENPSIQIQLRGTKQDYLTCYEKANSIVSLLNGMKNTSINDSKYIQMLCVSDILYLGRDSEERPLFSVNFNLQRAELS